MNYGHWVLEHLPKVIRASHTLEDSPQVIVKEPTKWQIESLNLIGVSNNDIRCIASDPILVKEFIQTDVKSVYSRDFSLCKENYLSIANIMKSRINLKQTSSSRIFVSRQSVGHRCVKNMNEVNSVLDQFDFEIIYPEKMSIKDQIKTFHHANVIMGATGSGLANMIFMENGSIFSLVDSSWISGLFYGLAQSLNHKFYSVLSRSRRIPHNIPHPYTGKPANNIIVDTDSLRKQLNNHLSR
jgi:capsular polysaccharide biosynthesis protein